MTLKKPASTGKSQQSLSEYVQSRIDSASERGFSDTKMWIRKDNYAEATEMLNTNGFKFTELQRDAKGGVQLEVSW